MDKRVLKEFAIMARRELRSQVTRMANSFGVYEDKDGEIEVGNDYVKINNKTYPRSYEGAYRKLIEVKREKGFNELIEEVAYTWFNRFIALRFMEVNDYLPSHIRVLSSETEGKVDPDILEEYEEADLDIDIKEISKIINIDKNLELAYRKILIAQCNKLSKMMPFLFEEIDDYTEMLLPDKLLIPESIIKKLVSTISEDDFKEEVEIIGWIYQYYISEKKDEVFADLKKNIKITKENIPAATQLFTPKWIVKYMVENSLGRLWLEGHPNEELQKEWKYYLEEADQEPEVEIGLQKIREEHAKLRPEDIKVLDPCMGSGHILVYAFDVLYEIYKSAGYSEREIPKLILQNNLYGLDIDDRASQLASFALIMKARQYNKRLFREIERENLELNLCSIQESNAIEQDAIEYFCSLETGLDNEELKKDLEYLVTTFTDAKEYGSILEVKEVNFEALKQRLKEIENEDNLVFGDYRKIILDRLPVMIKQAETMSRKYAVCVTNPPYMGSKGMGILLSKYAKEKYKNSKMDMFSMFVERCKNFVRRDRFYALITQPSILFLSSFKGLREDIISNQSIYSLLHMGRGIFGIDFGSTAFVIRNCKSVGYKGDYFRLHERTFQYISPNDIEKIYLNATISNEFKFDFLNYNKDSELNYSNPIKIRFKISQLNFLKIEGTPIAYWLNEKIFNTFNNKVIGNKLITREGMATADNERFLRLWSEVNLAKILFGCKSSNEANEKRGIWFPYNKGGDYRKWSGNDEYIVNWYNDGYEIKNNIDEKTGRVRSHNYNGEYGFKKGITWSAISSGNISVRFSSEGYLFDSKGAKGFSENYQELMYILALINSKVGTLYLKIFSPTMDFKVGDIIQIPLMENSIEYVKEIVRDNIYISKCDWNSFENSWDFQIHPLLKALNKNREFKISSISNIWEKECEENFNQLKSNEEELNRIFIDIYGLQDELTPDIEDKDITIRKADRVRDIKSFISYSVGCILGRYSIDAEGLIYAGGDFSEKWDLDNKKVRKIETDEDGNIICNSWVDATFMPNRDNVIPITDNKYFEDDIVARFIDFVRTVYSNETLEENIDFIAETLVKKGDETSRNRIRRYFMDEFYKDHCKVYQKRPIYWLVDSGKNKGFKSLVYLHRYNKETLSNIRLNYLLELQGKYINEEKKVERYLDSGTINVFEKKKRIKELQILSQKQTELLAFDKILDELANKEIELDLDDGVVVNYEKLQQVLAKIK